MVTANSICLFYNSIYSDFNRVGVNAIKTELEGSA